MKELCQIIKPYRCKYCGEEMLFFTSYNNTLIDYKKLFFCTNGYLGLYNALNNRGVKFLRCLVCKKNYLIDWSKKYPEQLTDKYALRKFAP